MKDEDWKAFIAREMERDLDDVMAEIEADPAMRDIIRVYWRRRESGNDYLPNAQ